MPGHKHFPAYQGDHHEFQNGVIQEQYGIKVKGGDRGAQSLFFCVMLSRSLFARGHCLSANLPIGKKIVSETFCYRFYLSNNLPATRA